MTGRPKGTIKLDAKHKRYQDYVRAAVIKTKRDGVEILVDKKEYFREYCLKNKDKYHRIIHCDCCDKDVSNLSNHKKTLNHIHNSRQEGIPVWIYEY